MNTLSLIILVLKFVLRELPGIVEAYKKAGKDRRYAKEADRIDQALKILTNKSNSRSDRLRAARELGK